MAEIAGLLAEFALAPCRADQAVREVLRLSLLDWAAVGLAGSGEPVAGILRTQAKDEGGAAQAGVIGSALRCPARMAALVNGATSHALDYDDTHFAHIGHPSVAVIPAALAAGELAGADGGAFQAAALVGAEASIRVGVWLGRGHYQAGFHQTATAGAFGAAVAAGRVLGLDAAQMAMALGLVATRASGLKSQFGTMGKPMNAGIAASSGVEAALLAAKGLVSAPGAVDGMQGFGPTHHGAGDMDGFAGLGEAWLFASVQHKFHACCHGLHATLEALSGLQAAADEVADIIMYTNPRWLLVCNIAEPRTGLEAKFSYGHVAALSVLGHDTGRLDVFTAGLCRDADVAALRGRVRVVGDESLSEMQARVAVTLTDGRVVELFHDLEADPGLEVRRQKVRAKAAALLGAEKADALWQMIEGGAAPAEMAAALAK